MNKILTVVALFFFIFMGFFSVVEVEAGNVEKVTLQKERVVQLKENISLLIVIAQAEGEEDMVESLEVLMESIKDIEERLEAKLDYDGMGDDEEELLRVEKNMKKLDSYIVDTVISVDLKGVDEEFDLSVSTMIDVSNKAMKMTFDMKLEDVRDYVEATGSLTYVDDNLYGRIDKLDVDPEIPEEEKEEFVGKNILIMENVLERIDDSLKDFIREEMPFIKEESLEAFSVEDVVEEIQEISLRLWEEGVVTVKETEGDYLDGERVKKYTLQVNEARMGEFLFQLMEDYNAFSFFEISPEEFQREIQFLEEEMQDENTETFMYVWSDGEHILKTSNISVTTIPEEEREFFNMPEEIKATLSTRYHGFNEKFTITAPEVDIDLEEEIEKWEEEREEIVSPPPIILS